MLSVFSLSQKCMALGWFGTGWRLIHIVSIGALKSSLTLISLVSLFINLIYLKKDINGVALDGEASERPPRAGDVTDID